MVVLSAGGLVSTRNPAREPSILSDLYPMQNQYQLYGNGQGLTLAGGFALYSELYKTQPNVQTVVNKLSWGMARVRLAVQERAANGDYEDVTDSSDFGKLLAAPNPKHSPAFFYLWNYSTFEVYGETIDIKDRPSRFAPPTALWPMHPANVTTQRDAEDGRLWYLIYAGVPASGQPVIAYPEEDVLHIRSYNPDTMVRGMSRLEALRGDLTNIEAMRQAQTSFWRKGARPATLLQAPGKLSQRALNRLKAQWDAMYSGADAWGKTAVLEEGVTATFQPMNLEQLQSIDTVKLSWQQACSLYDVPPPAIQILDHANYSNVTEELRSLYRETYGTRFDFFASEINFQLGQEFSPNGRYRMHYDTESIMQANPEAMMDFYNKGIQSGIHRPAEARAAFKLPAAGPEADQLYANAALVPLGTDRAGQPAGDAPASDGQEAPANPNPPQPPSQSGGAPQQDTTALPPPKAYDHPARPVLKVARLCGACETPQKTALSRRGWCRSCEGKAGRQKAITA